MLKCVWVKHSNGVSAGHLGNVVRTERIEMTESGKRILGTSYTIESDCNGLDMLIGRVSAK